MKILIVDDMRSVCLHIMDLLEKWGHSPSFFTDSTKGLEEIRALKEPAVIILDWEMPGLSGIDICRTLKKEPPQVPFHIIVLTAKSSKSDLSEALEAGANDFIGKPFDEHELKARLNAGIRILKLEEEQAERIKELRRSLKIIEEDNAAGRLVQERLLPEREKEIGGVFFEYLFMPSLYLSGDFLDFFSLDDKRVGFYYADVAGHGASSAFLTILLKSFISRLISDERQGYNDIIFKPAAVLDYLNRQFINLKLKKHLTMFYGILDSSQKKLLFSTGGQYPLPILSADNTAGFLVGKGLPLGIVPQAVYRQEEKTFSGRFKILCFSDGVFELLPGEDTDKKGSLMLDLFQNRDWGGEEWKDYLLGFSKVFPDDITLLKIEGDFSL